MVAKGLPSYDWVGGRHCGLCSPSDLIRRKSKPCTLQISNQKNPLSFLGAKTVMEREKSKDILSELSPQSG
jgi:hypothetical protein